MIQSYKKKFEVSDRHDVIVIGSGIGSMSTASILSQMGMKVLVLERHYTAGGYTHVFKRPGYEWDVGIHYIGDMGDEPKRFSRKLFDYVTRSGVKWADMGAVYDRVVIGDKIYDFPKGTSNLKEAIISYFPEEEDAIIKYFDLVFKTAGANRKYVMEKGLSPTKSKILGGLLRKEFLSIAGRTTYEVLSGLTKNEELIKVLTAQYGDYGLPPKRSSFGMHAMLVKHYFNGGYFPIGGSSTIADTISKVIAENGGSVLINAEVDKVLVEGGKATGVRMKDDHVFHADYVVSGIGVPNTYLKLFDTEFQEKHQIQAKLEQVRPSCAHICLYVGLNGTPEELNLPKANYWIYPEKGSHDEVVENYEKNIQAPLPVTYISFPAAKDPCWKERYPDKSTIDIITMVPYEVFEKWEDSRWKKRGEDYEELKEEFAQRLLRKLYEREPQLEGKVDHYELSSPITTRHFMNYDRGELYGLDHDPNRFRQKFLRPHSPVKNFYLTGQDILTVGLVGALASGLITASAMTKKNLMNEILG